MKQELPGNLESIELWCWELRAHLGGTLGENSQENSSAPPGSNLTDRDRFRIELLVRETLSNALEHGNGTESGGVLGVQWTLGPQEFTFQVTDQGAGFDPGEVVVPDDDFRGHGRGLEILKLYTKNLAWTGGGRTITWTMDLEQGEKNG